MAHGRAHARRVLDIAILPDRRVAPRERSEPAVQVGDRVGRDVDLVDLRPLSSVLRFAVVARRRRVAGCDRLACDRLETSVLKDFRRLKERQREHLAAIRETGMR